MTSFNACCSGPIESIDHELGETVEDINVEVTTQLDSNNKAKEGEDMGCGDALGIDPNISLGCPTLRTLQTQPHTKLAWAELVCQLRPQRIPTRPHFRKNINY